jgi:uncharacterized protein (TIGR04222 family)
VAGPIFDLRGPPFLALYLVIGCIVLILARNRMRSRELQDPAARIDLKEPLTIAYLRGGVQEALRVVTFSLIDRDLLIFDDRTVRANSRAGTLVRRPLEKAVLERAATPLKVSELIADARLQSLCEEHAQTLRERGFLASEDTYAARRPAFLVGFALLGGLAAGKILVALDRGHTNLSLLIVLAVIFLAALRGMYRRPRTVRGDEALTNLKVLLEGRKIRSKLLRAGDGNDDALLLAAVYGFAALPTDKFPYLGKLFPKNTGSSSSCGSSCGSGCGGGGCGGGCGGCGS